jgi:hypothetical protein
MSKPSAAGRETEGTIIHIVTSYRTTKPYTRVDDSTVKFNFLLHEGEDNQKIVWFTIHDNVKGFSIELEKK